LKGGLEDSLSGGRVDQGELAWVIETGSLDDGLLRCLRLVSDLVDKYVNLAPTDLPARKDTENYKENERERAHLLFPHR
jgi:hypothetical protein